MGKFGLLVIILSSFQLTAFPLEKVSTDGAPPVFDVSRPDILKNIKKSQAIKVNLQEVKELVFVSGQVALDPKTGMLLEGDIKTATSRVLDNVEAILKAAGSDWPYVASVAVFMKDWSDWEGMNEEYDKRFPSGIFPVRHTVVTSMDNLVEISCIAIVPKGNP